VPLTSALKERILEAYHGSRTRLPRASEVSARPNVRRLASLSRQASGVATLNLSTAVVEAGETAWLLVAPALEGDPSSLHRLREVTRSGMERNRRRRSAARGSVTGTREEARRSLPRTPCHGTPEQRRYLLQLIRFVRETSGHAEALPRNIQVRISRRMTSALGSCSYAGASRRVTISERLFRPGLEDLLWDTVKHELAHLADQVTSAHGTSCHGPSWREWARRLGARPERLCAPRDARRIEAAPGRRRGRTLKYPTAVARWLGLPPAATFSKTTPSIPEGDVR
jgi:predicted SprT family Zn-dependent metalloprotease